MLRTSNRGLAPGFLDLKKAVYANWDPGIPAKNQKDIFYNNIASFPDELTGVVLGFEQTDGVVEIKNILPDGKLQNDLFILYGHDNSINHAYVAEHNRIKGVVYKEIDRHALYDRFGINDGVTKESLRWVAQKANEHFSDYTPRSALKAVLRITREHDKSMISNDAMYFAVRSMLKSTEQVYKAKLSNPADPRLQTVFSSPENMKKLQELNTQLLNEKIIGTNGAGKPIVHSYDDKEGKLQQFMVEVRAAVGDFKEEVAASIESEINTNSITNKKSAKTISDLKLIAEVFRGNGDFPQHFNASMNEDPIFSEDEGYDVRVCQYIQTRYSQMSYDEAKSFAEDVVRDANKSFRRERTREKKGINSILAQTVDGSLGENPVNTAKNSIEINLDNVQVMCSKIQDQFDQAGHDAQQEFISDAGKKFGGKKNPSKLESDIAMLISRITEPKKSDRLDQNPVTSDQLVVEPTASFFDLFSRIQEEFTRLDEKRNEAGELTIEDKSYEDHLKIIQKIAHQSGLQNQVISSKIGGWMTMYDPQIEEVVIHDMSVVTRKSGFERFKGFSKDSIAVALSKSIKEIEFSPNSTPQKATLISTQIPPAEIERLLKEPVSNILKYLQESAIMYGRDVLTELNNIDRENGFGPSHENHFEDIINEYEQMDSAERTKKGDRFLQSLVMVDRGVLRATTRQLSTPTLTQNDSRPRIDGGIPRSIAVELMSGGKGNQRYELSPTEEYFTVATLRKAVNVTNKGGEDEVGVKANASYAVDSIIGRYRAYIAPVNSTFVERIAFALQEFANANEDGMIEFTKKGDNGEDLLDKRPVNFNKLVEFLQKTTASFADGSKANGKKDLVNEMTKIFEKAKISYDRGLETGGDEVALKAGTKIIKEGMDDATKNQTDFGTLLNVVQNVNQNRLLKAFDLSRYGRKHKKQVDQYVQAIRNAVKTKDSSDLRYMVVDKEAYEDNAEAATKARKSLTSLQYTIAEKLSIGKYAVEALKQQGLQVATTENLSIEGKNTLKYSHEYSESRDVMNVLRNQLYMANVWGSGFNGVHANPANPYVEEIEETFPGGKVKSISPKGNFSDIMMAKVKAFNKAEIAQEIVELLKKGHEANKAPIEDYSNAFNLFAGSPFNTETTVSDTAIVAPMNMEPTVYALEQEESHIVEKVDVEPIVEAEILQVEKTPVIVGESELSKMFPSLEDLADIDEDGYDFDDLTMSDIESLTNHMQQRQIHFEDIGTEWNDSRPNGAMVGGTSL